MRISDWSSDVCSSDLHRRTELAVVQRRSEQLRACALRPGVPVTDEQLVEQHAGGFPRGECVEFLLAARDVALALGKYFARERDARAVGREMVVVDVERQIADRLGFAAGPAEQIGRAAGRGRGGQGVENSVGGGT